MHSQLARTLLVMITWTLLSGEAMARTIDFKTTQVTDAEVAVSPDGQQLVLTILGHLYRLPVTGGDAEQLTSGACYDNDPSFSPDGRHIAFISDRDASGGNVFLLELATRKVTQVTHESHASQPTWTPDGKAILYLRHLPREEDPRRASIFGAIALCDLRRISLGGDGKPETLRSPGLIRSVFYLPGEQPAWTVVEQESTPGRMFPRSTTHVETINPKDGKVTRLRSVQGDLGRVAVGPKGDGLYSRSAELQFLPLAGGAARRVSTLSAGAGGFGGGSPTKFAVTADGKSAYLSGRGQILKVALETGEREPIPVGARVKQDTADPRGRIGPRRKLVAQCRHAPCLARNCLRMVAASISWQPATSGNSRSMASRPDAFLAMTPGSWRRPSRRMDASSLSCAASLGNEHFACWTCRAGKCARWWTCPTVRGRDFQAGAAMASGSCISRVMPSRLHSAWLP